MQDRRLLLVAIFHALVGTCANYYVSALNQVQAQVERLANASAFAHYGVALDDAALAWVWSAVAASCSLGAFAGAILAKWPSARLGNRDTCMLLKNVVLITSAVLQFLAQPLNSIELLFVGRFLSGVAVVAELFISVFLAECAPTRVRGLVASIPALGIPLWNAAGTAAGLPALFGTDARWSFLMLVPIAPATVHLLLTASLPRSPKFLFIQKGDRAAAADSLAFYHGENVDTLAELQAFEREAALADHQDDETVGFRRIWQTRHLRWPFVICVVVNAVTNFGGIDITTQYSTRFIELLGVPTSQAAVYTLLLTQAPNVLFTLIGLALVENFGRRGLMLVGVGIGGLATSCLFISGLLDEGRLAIVVGIGGLILSQAAYFIGPSFIAAMLPGELCPQSSRAYTSGFSFAVGWGLSIVIIGLYPPMQLSMGAFAILPQVVLSVISFAWLAVYMPETRRRDVDEIVRAWRLQDDESVPLLKPSLRAEDSGDRVANYGGNEKR